VSRLAAAQVQVRLREAAAKGRTLTLKLMKRKQVQHAACCLLPLHSIVLMCSLL
jgi:hypothetical protein